MKNLTSTYQRMTKKDLTKALADLSKYPTRKPQREFTVLTGLEGQRQFNNALDIEALNQLLDSIERRGLVDRQEYRGVQDMLKSKDWRDIELARSIIETKQKNTENEPNI